jgi:hypothetical protein
MQTHESKNIRLYGSIVCNYLAYIGGYRELSNLYLKNLDKYVNKAYEDSDLLYPYDDYKDREFKTFVHALGQYKILSKLCGAKAIMTKKQIENLLDDKNFINQLLRDKDYIKYIKESESYFNINTDKFFNFVLSPRGVFVITCVIALGTVVGTVVVISKRK